MLPSWLTQRGGESPSEVMHAVLGTPLRAPLMSDQEEALFACGCFWGAEKGFWRLPGVVTTAVGYAGGERVNPTYQEVCSGTTGHTEVVRVVWSTPAVDFSDLLKLFWECHDPTQGNRQGNDTGTQYRSAIYTTTDQQMSLAQASRTAYQASLNQRGFGPITQRYSRISPFISLSLITSSTSPNPVVVRTARPCRPRLFWGISTAITTAFHQRSGRPTTGASTTAFYAATMHRSAWLEMTDRQVLIAIGLTVLLVIGLVFSTRTPEASRGPELLWREAPAPPPSRTLEI